MPVVRWVFTDTFMSDSYTFAVNPREGGTPVYEKNISSQNTSAPGGKTLLFEGRDVPQQNTFSGVILEQVDLDKFIEFFNRRHQFQLTDDLGRVYEIYITKFEPTRERAVHYPWKHSYTVTYTILNWP